MNSTIGTCSLFSGRVTLPAGPWASVIPPVPSCEDCGAVAAEHGPVIPMTPRPMKGPWTNGLGGLCTQQQVGTQTNGCGCVNGCKAWGCKSL